jgi:hypothetical protein
MTTSTEIAEARLCAASAHSAAAPQLCASLRPATQLNEPSPRHTALHSAALLNSTHNHLGD